MAEKSVISYDEFMEAYALYPLKSGRSTAWARYKREIKPKQTEDFKRSIIKYKQVLANETFERRPMNFTTFVGSRDRHPWTDYLDEDVGFMDNGWDDVKRLLE